MCLDEEEGLPRGLVWPLGVDGIEAEAAAFAASVGDWKAVSLRHSRKRWLDGSTTE